MMWSPIASYETNTTTATAPRISEYSVMVWPLTRCATVEMAIRLSKNFASSPET